MPFVIFFIRRHLRFFFPSEFNKFAGIFESVSITETGESGKKDRQILGVRGIHFLSSHVDLLLGCTLVGLHFLLDCDRL